MSIRSHLRTLQASPLEIAEQEKKFSALLENASDGVALLDRDGHVIYAGPSTPRLLGYTRDELLARPARDLLVELIEDPSPETVSGEIVQAHLLRWRRWLGRSNNSRAHEVRVRHRDGSERWLKLTLTNRLRDPQWSAIVVNFHDITPHRETEHALLRTQQEVRSARDAMQAREAELHSLFDNVLATVLVTGDAGTQSLLDEHPLAHQILGLSSEAVVNLSAQDFLAPEVRHLVPTLRDFRALFDEESDPEDAIDVQEKTLFFSDLKGSTSIYETSGDEPAYGLVRAHFDYVFRAIEAHHGDIVKTIGDAVMAAFDRPEDAVAACLEMQSGVDEFNALLQETPHDDVNENAVIIKIGLHHGPAIAVKSNGRVDYFGRTVNIAARLSAASMGRDIICSGDVWERPETKALRAKYPLEVKKFQGNLKGIQGLFTLYRLEVKDAPK